jgi:hypothetical protein
MPESGAMLASVLADVAPDQRYAGSVTAVTAFAKDVAEQSAPSGLPNDARCTQADTALAQAQTTALKWFNSVYPSALEVPQAVTDQADGITASLQALSTAAGQLAGDPGNTELRTALANSATALSQRVQPLQQRSSQLTASLSGFSDDQTTAVMDLRTAGGGLQGLANQLNAQICQDMGQLDSLQNAPCPNSGDIRAASDRLSTDQGAFIAVVNFGTQLQQAGQGGAAALAGLQYLAGTWSMLGDLAETIVRQLTAVATDPAAIAQLDLATAEQGWATLSGHIAAIATRTQAAVTQF